MSTTLNDIALTNATTTTQATSDNSSKLATTAFVQALITALNVNVLLSPNGWLKIAGLVIQWGHVASDINGGAVFVSFPIAFPNACFVVDVTTLSPTDRITYVQNGSVGASGFTIANNGSSGFAYWIAIGH